MEKEELIGKLLEQDVLISPELLEGITEEETKRLLEGESEDDILSSRREEEKVSAGSEPEKTPAAPAVRPPKMDETKEFPQNSQVKIIHSYDKPSKKRTYQDFVQHFRKRYTVLSAMLQERRELMGATSISRILARREQEKTALIGMVTEKRITKNKNVIMKVEDLTGEISVIATAKNPEALRAAEDVVLDEVIGVVGSASGDALFVDNIIYPDVPSRELKCSPVEEYAIFIGDPQVGSKLFMKREFETMLAWVCGEVGDERQRAIAEKIRYIIIAGDLVEGVGVYPGQEEELEIKDIKDQYEVFAQYMKKLPEHIAIIACPGNHDAGRISEPQPPIYKDFAASVYALPNTTLISSPGTINFGAKENFGGFNLLLYHGYSFIYYADNIPSIRNAGGLKAVDRIMQFLLQRRHLAPSHGSNRYIPDADEDPLIITTVPDFFITGHVHRAAAANYRNITMINASTWVDISDNEERRGLEPQPARLPIVNLKTREVKIMNFYPGKKSEEATR